MITTNLQGFVQSLGLRCYVKRPTPIEGDWRLANWEMPCVVLMPAPTADYVKETSGTREVREFDLLDLRAVDVTFDTAESDTQCEAARVELLQVVQQLGALFHVEQRGGRQIWDSANGCLIVGWSVSLRLTELVGLSACDGLPVDPAEIEITENGTYNVLPFGRAVVDVQGGSPAVVEQLDVTPDYDAHTFNPPAGVDGFAPVEVAACPIPETDVLNVTPDNDPHQYLPEHGIGFSVVNVAACPVCPVPDVRPLSVTPSRNAQTFSPSGFDGYAPVEVDGYTPVLQTKSATPSTSAQTITADAGYDGLDEVGISAVTASIDPNIQASNIKLGVSILGVAGTMQPMPEGDEITIIDGNVAEQTYTSVTERTTEIQSNAFYSSTALASVKMDKVPNILGSAFLGATALKRVSFKSCYDVRGQAFSQCPLVTFAVGVLTGVGNTFIGSTAAHDKVNLECFEVGQDTDINLPLQRWTATNVIAEGQDAIDELNSNIQTYLAARVKDNSGGGPTRTITFGTALYNVLTADTIAAFTDKGWSVAYA